jgi:hypothetical protein
MRKLKLGKPKIEEPKQETAEAKPEQAQQKTEKVKEKKPQKTPKKAPLRVIVSSNNYLRRQVRKYLAATAALIAVFFVIIISLTLRILFFWSLDILELTGFLASIAPILASYFFLHKYKVYSGGLTGEKDVTATLKKKFNADYTLINSLYLEDHQGDIDHVLLAPNGIFVLETKNWSGKIVCNGDLWKRVGKPDRGSPSRQVQRNAAKIKHMIDLMTDFRGSDVWVEGIVVFTNQHASFDLRNVTVAIVELKNLTEYIATRQTDRSYSSQQSDEIGVELLNKNVKRVLRGKI